MHDSFAVIRWEAAGIGPSTVGVPWSLSVAAEVVVFFFVGRPLLDRIGPAHAAMLATAAGIVRWAVMAETTWIPALAAIQPLHGLTFALLHLTCMRPLAQSVPGHLEATALTVYGTVGHRRTNRSADTRFGPAVHPFGGVWFLGDDRALCRGATFRSKAPRAELSNCQPRRSYEGC